MIEQVRDGLLAQKKGMSDEHRAKVSREADRQFSTTAASSMEEAINNAMLIVGKETPKQDDGQDARRKSRRGGKGLTPTQQAEMEEDDSLDEIFLKYNNLN
ncbi:MAG: hypothetical protein GY927_13625 [bacterium]|nr:hypothetical protein [bacterium]